MTLALLGFYSVLVVAVAILGAILPRLIPLTHTRMQLLMSLVAGFMLGVSMLHLIPHAYAELGSLDQVMLLVLVGLLAMFFLMRLFHVHTHEFEEIEVIEGEDGNAHAVVSHDGEHSHEPHVHGPDCKHDHDHSHSHSHDHGHGHAHDHDHIDRLMQGSSLAWLGLFAGLAVHTITDGMFLAASVAAESEHQAGWIPAGMGTFLAVFLHKPLDTLSIAVLMRASGWSNRAIWIVSIMFGLMCPLGSAIFMLGVQNAGDSQPQIIGMALALGAGFFLCISLADLLPELSFHSHDRTKLSIALLAGIVISYLIGFLEPKHAHDHKPSTQSQDHDHAGHSH
jgi:zinc and cadmium transporter